MANNQRNPSLAALMEEFASKMATLFVEFKKDNQTELQALRSKLRELRAQMVDGGRGDCFPSQPGQDLG
ncbi:hypothetical protein RHGRI_001727 [Rhododendron griersonianum]|uniref:Uncharacterized protein n=1 Tax=Rhododendron griersonianum TaxID=479676 RepID=A0AAV6LL93_9ERIC|nr:hypothetical protein RHGRI_001727 [Rhododendron griersonianum]